MLGYREFGYRFTAMPSQASNIESLVNNIPSMLVVELLTAAFFAEVNWRYGGFVAQGYRCGTVYNEDKLRGRRSMPTG